MKLVLSCNYVRGKFWGNHLGNHLQIDLPMLAQENKAEATSWVKVAVVFVK